MEFYPNEKAHSKKEYLDWKFNIITRIIDQHSIDSKNIHIYDDFEDIIFRLRENISLNQKIHCNLIKKQTDWILEEIPVL